MLERPLKSRIVQRHQGPALELRYKRRHPNATDPDRQEKIKQIKTWTGLFESRHHHPVDIHKINENQRAAEHGKSLASALDRAHKQKKKGNCELEKNQGECDDRPAACGADDIPRDLIENVAGPDDEKL